MSVRRDVESFDSGPDADWVSALVLVNCSRWRAAVMVTLAMAAKALLVSELNRIIGLHLC